MDFYVYSYTDPLTNLPFYVGKGKKNRAFAHLNRANKKRIGSTESGVVRRCRHLLNLNLTPVIKLIHTNLSEDEAFSLECHYINLYVRIIDGGILENLTLGGEGTSGLKQSPAHIEKRVSQTRGKTRTEEAKEKMRGKRVPSSKLKTAAIARANRPEQKQRVSDFFSGREVSNSTKAKISATMKLNNIKPSTYFGAKSANSHCGTALWLGELKTFKCLKTFCESIGLNYSTARNTLRENRPIKRGEFKGFQLLTLDR